MKNAYVVVICVVVSVVSSAAFGLTFDQIQVEQWVGAGGNEAMCIFDFGGGDSYAFGYRWDDGGDDETGWDMLQAIAAHSSLEIEYTEYIWGVIVEKVQYAGKAIVDDYYGSGDYIGYWVSGNAPWTDYFGDPQPGRPDGDGETWDTLGFGVGGRVLSDGWWDGWTQEQKVVNDGVPVNTPAVPFVPGDANMDGMVDLQDFGILKANFGGPGDWAQGDFNDDGGVDLQDFGVLKSNFAGGAGAVVPEPASLLLLTAGASLLIGRLRKA